MDLIQKEHSHTTTNPNQEMIIIQTPILIIILIEVIDQVEFNQQIQENFN